MRGQPKTPKNLYDVYIGNEYYDGSPKLSEAKIAAKQAKADYPDAKVFVVGYSLTDITEVK